MNKEKTQLDLAEKIEHLLIAEHICDFSLARRRVFDFLGKHKLHGSYDLLVSYSGNGFLKAIDLVCRGNEFSDEEVESHNTIKNNQIYRSGNNNEFRQDLSSRLQVSASIFK